MAVYDPDTEDGSGADKKGAILPFLDRIGNYERGLPELLVVGLGKDWAGMILILLGAKEREQQRGFEPGELVNRGGAFPVRISDGGAVGRELYAQRVRTFYRTNDFALRQVIMPDPEGRWPADPGCALPFSRQPILSAQRHLLH